MITIRKSFKSQIDKIINTISQQETEIEIAKSLSKEIKEKVDIQPDVVPFDAQKYFTENLRLIGGQGLFVHSDSRLLHYMKN